MPVTESPWTDFSWMDDPEYRAAKERAIIGSTFGQLRIIRREGGGLAEARAKWRCECSCGNTLVLTTNELRYGGRTHCGCEKPTPAVLWPFPKVVGRDGLPISHVWRAANAE